MIVINRLRDSMEYIVVLGIYFVLAVGSLVIVWLSSFDKGKEILREGFNPLPDHLKDVPKPKPPALPPETFKPRKLTKDALHAILRTALTDEAVSDQIFEGLQAYLPRENADYYRSPS